MAKLKENTKFVVVNFGNKPGTRLLDVELVPECWMFFTNEIWKCFYPTHKDYEHVDEWVLNSRKPSKSWPSFEVDVLGQASTYEQGLRQLKRSYTTNKVESSSSEERITKSKEKETLDLDDIPEFTNQRRQESELDFSSKKTVNSEHETVRQQFKYSDGSEQESDLDHLDQTDPIPRSVLQSSHSHFEKNLNSERDVAPKRKDHTEPIPRSVSHSSTSRTAKNSNSERNVPKRNDHTELIPCSVSHSSTSRTAKNSNSERNVPKRNDHTELIPCSVSHSSYPRTEKNSNSESDMPKQKDHLDKNSDKSRKNRENRNFHASTPVRDSDVDELEDELMYKKLCCFIKKNLDSVHRSLQYDFAKAVREIKALDSFKEMNVNFLDDVQKTIDISLPITELDVFLRFDDEISDPNNDRRKALIRLIQISAKGCKTMEDAVKDIIPAVIAKPIQLQYSACGRIQKGKAKKNFSKTTFFQLISDIFISHYSVDQKSIVKRISRWLSGACDRDGGKKERAQNLAENT